MRGGELGLGEREIRFGPVVVEHEELGAYDEQDHECHDSSQIDVHNPDDGQHIARIPIYECDSHLLTTQSFSVLNKKTCVIIHTMQGNLFHHGISYRE